MHGMLWELWALCVALSATLTMEVTTTPRMAEAIAGDSSTSCMRR